jgi:hypothetical protein
MGMFDKPQFLTGKDGTGYVEAGDTFWLHKARPAGTVQLGGEPRPQVKLKVSRTLDGDTDIVYTAGRAIVNQIERMDESDMAAMPIEVRLDEIPAKVSGRNPTNVLTPASSPTPASVAADDDIPF